MTDLLSLADQLEKAEIGSRELDARIAEAISAEDVLIQTDIATRAAPFLSKGVNFYTTSVDAALSLVPEGWTIFGLIEGNDEFMFTLVNSEISFKHGEAKTLPLAISAASLRALAMGDL